MSTLPLKIPGGNELMDSKEVLEKIGLKESDKVADLGCGGKGYFSLQAAKLVGNKGLVYAVDILKSVLKNVENEAKLRNICNLKTVWSNLEIGGATKINQKSLDVCLLINILFQTEKHFEVIKEAVRLLKNGGKLAIIDWKATAVAFGPSPKMRVSSAEVRNYAKQFGLKEEQSFEAGKFHYGIIFVKT